MAKQIIWSNLSEIDFDNILEYLFRNWDNKVTEQFMDLTEKTLLQIAESPKQFPLINKKFKIRKCVLTKHNIKYYRESKTQIEILRIYDTGRILTVCF